MLSDCWGARRPPALLWKHGLGSVLAVYWKCFCSNRKIQKRSRWAWGGFLKKSLRVKVVNETCTNTLTFSEISGTFWVLMMLQEFCDIFEELNQRASWSLSCFILCTLLRRSTQHCRFMVTCWCRPVHLLPSWVFIWSAEWTVGSLRWLNAHKEICKTLP